MFCTKCGQRVNDGQSYCTACGASMESIGNDESSHSTQLNGMMMPDYASGKVVAADKSKAPIIVAVLIALAAITAAVAIVFLVAGAFNDTLHDGAVGGVSDTIVTSKVPESNTFSPTESQAGSSLTPEASDLSQEDEETEVEFIGITDANATSFLPTQGINTSNYSPWSVLDGKKSTCWAEGASGSGIGESITLFGQDEQLFSGFTIRNGYQKSEDIYYKNNRPKVIMVFVDGVLVEVVDLEDSGLVTQTFRFAEPVIGRDITFEIDDVYSGSRYSDCCISEIDVF